MSNKEDKGNINIEKGSVNCNFCRCGKKVFHKETKTTTDKDGNVVVNQVEDRSSWRIGNGRGATPDGNDVFKQDNQLGSVEICSTGWNDKQQRITPEEVEEQVDVLRTEVKEIKTDVEMLKHNLNIMD